MADVRLCIGPDGALGSAWSLKRWLSISPALTVPIRLQATGPAGRSRPRCQAARRRASTTPQHPRILAHRGDAQLQTLPGRRMTLYSSKEVGRSQPWIGSHGPLIVSCSGSMPTTDRSTSSAMRSQRERLGRAGPITKGALKQSDELLPYFCYCSINCTGNRVNSLVNRLTIFGLSLM